MFTSFSLHVRNLFPGVLCLGFVIAASGTVFAQVTIFRGVRLIDGTGGPARENVDLIIDGEKIVGIAPAGKTTAGNAHTVDCTGKTVIPGLISAHSHVGQVDGISRIPENYNRDNIVRQLRQYEVYGITTIVALGMNQQLFYAIREQAHAGTIPGADLFGADRGIGVGGGAPSIQALSGGGSAVDRPQTAEEGRDTIRNARTRGTDLIKIWLDGSRGTVPKMSPEVYTAVIDEAHRNGLRVAAHIFDLEDAKALVDAGVDIIAHGVRDKPVDQEFIEKMKERNVWYIATLALDDAFFVFAEHPEWLEKPFLQNALHSDLKVQFADPEWRAKTLASPATVRGKESLRMNQRNLAILYEAGVNIGFGTDSGAMPLRVPGFMEHRELELMAEAGLDPFDVITIATGKTAQLIQLTDRGTLVSNQLADFIILDADPSEEILNSRKIHSVWHRGKVVTPSVATFVP